MIEEDIVARPEEGESRHGNHYSAIDRKLVIEEAEAETVRTLYRLYLQHANAGRVREEADRLGLRTKARKPNNGGRNGGEPFTRGHLYKLLSNPIYVGEVVHKGEHHAGEHDAIIDRETWDAVPAATQTTMDMQYWQRL